MFHNHLSVKCHHFKYMLNVVAAVKGKKYLLFGGGFGLPSGVWMVTQNEPRTLVIAGHTLKQCAVIESLGIILMLLEKVGCFSQSSIPLVANA
jgi:hypothetical protein